MPLTRLLIFSTLVSLSAMLASAQSQTNHDSLAVSQDAQAMGSRFNAEFNAEDQLLPILNLTGEPGVQNTSVIDPAEQMPVDHHPFPSSRRALPSEAALGMDGFCLAIRSYRVMRDDPNSDSVHRVAYSTCVPAARVHMYTATEVSVERPESGR
jgi:hypothetical protein